MPYATIALITMPFGTGEIEYKCRTVQREQGCTHETVYGIERNGSCIAPRRMLSFKFLVAFSSTGYVQCRHSIPALNAWATRAWYTTARPIGIQLSWHGWHQDWTWVIDVLLNYFWHIIHGYLYNYALVDVRSIGAGIKCLYCTSVTWEPSIPEK